MHFQNIFRRLLAQAGKLSGAPGAGVIPIDDTAPVTPAGSTYVPSTKLDSEEEIEAEVDLAIDHAYCSRSSLGSLLVNMVASISGKYYSICG